jgi:hypothetical protein
VYVTAFAARLLDFDRDIDRRVMAAVLALARQIGGATITSVEDYRTQVRENVENATQIAELAAAWRRVRGRKRPKALRLSRVLPWRPRSMLDLVKCPAASSVDSSISWRRSRRRFSQ